MIRLFALSRPSQCADLLKHWRADANAGFLVFLIALPLCLGIAIASGFPPMAGVISAVVGGLLVSRINGSRLTITGPAAGLITVLLGAVDSLGQGDAVAGYRYTLAAVVVAGVLQILLGWLKAGKLAAFFPASVVHGMLAAIGIIIMVKQSSLLLGVQPADGSVFQSIARLPDHLLHFNPETALIGGSGLLILFAWPLWQKRGLGKLPAPIMVILAGMLLGMGFDLAHSRLYLASIETGTGILHRHEYVVASQLLAGIPAYLSDIFVFPDFSKLGSLAFWAAVFSLCLIGSIESLLVVAAIDRLDPERGRSDLDRDLAAIGIGNVLSGLIGGMPMIAEIVRGSANIEYGAKSGWSNFFHAVFMLMAVVLFAGLLHNIPLASLSALLIYAGFRLASPRAFAKTMDIGKEQLALFVVTIVAILASNILLGVFIGIAAKLMLHRWRGVGLRDLFHPSYSITQDAAGSYHVSVDGAAVFSNLIALQSRMMAIPEGETVVFDLSSAALIDHTVMDYIDRYCQDYSERGGRCAILGLDLSRPSSSHPLAARLRKMPASGSVPL